MAQDKIWSVDVDQGGRRGASCLTTGSYDAHNMAKTKPCENQWLLPWRMMLGHMDVLFSFRSTDIFITPFYSHVYRGTSCTYFQAFTKEENEFQRIYTCYLIGL